MLGLANFFLANHARAGVDPPLAGTKGVDVMPARQNARRTDGRAGGIKFASSGAGEGDSGRKQISKRVCHNSGVRMAYQVLRARQVTERAQDPRLELPDRVARGT
jgi:hypothetical protein